MNLLHIELLSLTQVTVQFEVCECVYVLRCETSSKKSPFSIELTQTNTAS